METGIVNVEKIRGKSTVTRCFSKYPIKFIVPNKAVSSKIDAVWIFTLSYGGGIVSGDRIFCKITVGKGCTMAFTTQASTKVYRSLGAQCSKQILEVEIGSDAFVAIIPDPVTCFSTARYSQKQVFRINSDSNLVIVDWITSGRYESGEKWDFSLYESTNHIFLPDNHPLFLDTILLESGGSLSIRERMQNYQVIAMIIILGPKLKHVQDQVKDEVKKMMSEHFQSPARTSGHYNRMLTYEPPRPTLLASCSEFGATKGGGTVVRVAANTTELVQRFLRHNLSGLEVFIGASPYT